MRWLLNLCRRLFPVPEPAPSEFSRPFRAFFNGCGTRPRRGSKRLRAWLHRRGDIRRLVAAQGRL